MISKRLNQLLVQVRLSRQFGSLVQASSNLSVVEMEVEDHEVVPGDIIILSAGDLIPADAIIISSHALTVSQSMVTGEVFPTEKGVKTRFNDLEKEEEVIHRRNVLLGGTSITSGECHALAVNTGSRSYAASIATHSRKARPINAFERSIRRISYLLLGFMGVMTPLVFIIQGVTNKAGGWMVSSDCVLSIRATRLMILNVAGSLPILHRSCSRTYTGDATIGSERQSCTWCYGSC